jgi:tetratricopeptide (TPR) repeat protein
MGDQPAERPASDTLQEGGEVIDEHFYMSKATTAFIDEDYERALSYYSRALQYNITLEAAWLGQLRCLIELRELQEAIIWSNRALEKYPDSPDILAARGIAESRIGRTVAAIAYVDGALRGKSCTPYTWVARGEVLIPTNIKNAEACFNKAIELSPKDWQLQAWIARSYLVHGHHSQALDHLRQAVRLEPNCPTCWYWIGRCWEVMGDTSEAVRAYIRALSGSSINKKAREALSRIENRGLITKLTHGCKRLFNHK